MNISSKRSKNLDLQVIRYIGINAVEESYFTKLFEATVIHLIPAKIRETWIYFSDLIGDENCDFKYLKELSNLRDLRLLIIRKTIYQQEQWHGFIQDYKRQFKIIAVLQN